jgi:hypothetical protein
MGFALAVALTGYEGLLECGTHFGLLKCIDGTAWKVAAG